MTARGRKRAEGAVVSPTVDLRLGRWQDVLGDVRPDAVICDPPYGARTHAGDVVASGIGRDGTYRTAIDYACWTAEDVAEFVGSWAPRTRCWIVAMTSHDLIPSWESAFYMAGWQSFAPVSAVIAGMGVRLLGDGPASWTIHIVVARRRAKRLSTVAGCRSIWRSLPGGYTGPSSPTMAGGRGKPSWLVEALVEDYSDPGMLVCDPCAGWGSTLVAARKLGRSAIGAEIDADAYAIAARRVVGEESRPRPEQPSLFQGVSP